MSVIYTLDASVFLSAFNPKEPHHPESRRFLDWLRKAAAPIIVPTLLLPEMAAVLVQGRRDADLVRRFTEALRRLPHLTLVPLDEVLASRAAGAAAEFGLRGSDAVYAGVALRFGSRLVTLDAEQRERVSPFVPVRHPAEVLMEIGI
jgi:predicted nucleic acid-binding protein